MGEQDWWLVAWIAGVVVVLAVAVLLLVIIAIARRIRSQAGDIVVALEGAQRNTLPLFDIALANHALNRIVRGLAGPHDERGREPA